MLKFTRAIKCVRAKFVVTGELAVFKHLKAAAPGNIVTNLPFHSSNFPYFSFVPMQASSALHCN